MKLTISSQSKLHPAKQRQSRGFTLLEMIGVLAVIAILAAVLIPKVFAAIDNARVSNSAMSCNTIKTAIADHYAKFGSLTAAISTTSPVLVPVPGVSYDTNLVLEGFLDKPFAVKIGDGTTNTTLVIDGCTSNSVAGTAPATLSLVSGAEAAFNLGGTTDANNLNQAIGSDVVMAIIHGVNLNDARSLKALIDGNSASFAESAIGTALKGRVKYDFAGNTATPTIVYIYITHR